MGLLRSGDTIRNATKEEKEREKEKLKKDEKEKGKKTTTKRWWALFIIALLSLIIALLSLIYTAIIF